MSFKLMSSLRRQQALMFFVGLTLLSHFGFADDLAGSVINSSHFKLKMVPGPNYSYTTGQTIWGFIPISYTVRPQVAVWIETMDGRYLDTLYITDRVSKQNWLFAPKEGRPEALPVWTHLRKEKNDAVSSATPMGETNYTSQLAKSLETGRYIIKLETNRSYDYNESYPKENGIGGQPSLIYQAILEIVDSPQEVYFEVIGTGSPDGSDGQIRAGVKGITTALDLFSSLSIQYTLEKKNN